MELHERGQGSVDGPSLVYGLTHQTPKLRGPHITSWADFCYLEAQCIDRMPQIIAFPVLIIMYSHLLDKAWMAPDHLFIESVGILNYIYCIRIKI